MRITWPPLAIQRIREAAEYIARDRPQVAKRWVTGAFKTVGRLAELPHSGRVVPELGRPDIREVIYGPYRVIYRVSPKTVLILTVRHGKQMIDEAEVEE